MKARVVHISEPHDVFIGRPGKWGNPFVIGVNGTRNEVISQYAGYVRRNGALMRWIRLEIHGKVLGCDCGAKPGQRCPGLVLANIAEQEHERWKFMSHKERRRLRRGYEHHRYYWEPHNVTGEFGEDGRYHTHKVELDGAAGGHVLECFHTDGFSASYLIEIELDELKDPIIKQALIDFIARDL